MSVRSHVSKNDVHVQTSRTFFVHVACGRGPAQSFSDDNAIRYILHVLCLTSCFLIMRHMKIAHFRRGLIRQRAPATYTFTVKRLRTALASTVAVVTFANDCVARGEVCYHRLPCSVFELLSVHHLTCQFFSGVFTSHKMILGLTGGGAVKSHLIPSLNKNSTTAAVADRGRTHKHLHKRLNHMHIASLDKETQIGERKLEFSLLCGGGLPSVV